MLNVLIDLPMLPEYVDRIRAIETVRVRAVTPEFYRGSLPKSLLNDVHVLACIVPPSNFDDMSSLRLIQIGSSGYTQLFGLSIAERGIRACNARGVFDTAIAEWNIAMMINLTRDLRAMIRNQDNRTWQQAARFQHELCGKVVGIWGYGGIGRQTARLAKAMGMIVHVMTRNGIAPRENVFLIPGTGDTAGTFPDRVFLQGQEAPFLQTLDYLIITMPLTHVTQGLIGYAELCRLPQHSFVLNPSCAAIIDENALLRALDERRIAGAALDAHYSYPMPPEHPLWRFPNVIMTPDVSGSWETESYGARIGAILYENILRFKNSAPLLNELTPNSLSGY